ncbi:LysR family transcriptional regulator [Burkholderia cepacia]|uniref:LysR family transcriptional regulator n=1 Tax=Burkholderia cepacia TaxID=292 RepID=UPI001CF40F8E|nr:LysR family transcriptional regulator [Burkholderia cepacia]MCA8355917.1 LysR family transcriptional regulator [Burkholderia cepacia]
MIVRNFEYLIALEREGHFGKAAKVCNVSQPTLSAGIRQLEKDLDVKIVRHGPRYDGLTKEGALVLALAQQMHNDCEGLRRELSTLQRHIDGHFRLGVISGAVAVATILSVALSEKMPLMEQSITTDNASNLISGLREDAFDIALGYLEDLNIDDVETHLLYREKIFLFQSNSNPQERNVTWDQVEEQQLCLLKSSLPESAQAQLARRAGTIYTDSIDVLVAHVAGGRYSTVLPQTLSARLKQVPHLQALAITGPGSQASVGFVASKDGFDSKPLATLLELVNSTAVVSPIQELLDAHRNLHPNDISKNGDTPN